MTLSITAIILTLDEELNLPHCLKSLEGWCREVFIVDSGSSDGTLPIARAHGAAVIQHPFETHAKQWNWALKTLPITGEWVLALDADQRVTPELKEEILSSLPKSSLEIKGYYLPRKQIFRGKWIRHGGYWPKYLLKLFRRGCGWSDEQELVDFRFYVDGETRRLRYPILEQNRKEDQITFWLQKHLRYIELQAQEEHHRRHHRIPWTIKPLLWGTPDQQVLWLKNLWYRLPLYVRPFLYFIYRFVFRLGVLDGPEGILFHFLQGFWLRLMIDVRLGELEREAGRGQ
ncbi:MAG: glycosyltransferase family 2 protein [Candidatus Omnitrophica bacterium]|nr:glycosyltransferase family 2 protein [Candidatus Omnitrophota bacterium]